MREGKEEERKKETTPFFAKYHNFRNNLGKKALDQSYLVMWHFSSKSSFKKMLHN